MGGREKVWGHLIVRHRVSLVSINPSRIRSSAETDESLIVPNTSQSHPGSVPRHVRKVSPFEMVRMLFVSNAISDNTTEISLDDVRSQRWTFASVPISYF